MGVCTSLVSHRNFRRCTRAVWPSQGYTEQLRPWTNTGALGAPLAEQVCGFKLSQDMTTEHQMFPDGNQSGSSGTRKILTAQAGLRVWCIKYSKAVGLSVSCLAFYTDGIGLSFCRLLGRILEDVMPRIVAWPEFSPFFLNNYDTTTSKGKEGIKTPTGLSLPLLYTCLTSQSYLLQRIKLLFYSCLFHLDTDP